MTRQMNIPFRAIVVALGILGCCLCGQPSSAQDYPSPTVGVPAKISSLVLPGTKLKGKPLIDDAPMVVSVINAFEEVDGFRYDLEFQGFEPRKYDLAKWLVREDGSATDDLPVVEVEVLRLLPEAGIQLPNELETGQLPELGGYGSFAKAVAIAWGIGLLCLIFLRGPKRKNKNAKKPTLSLADLLKDRLRSVFEGNSDPKQHAELERLLFAMWRRRLGLEGVSADEAMRKIRQHEDAGQLMQQLEEWMHSPSPSQNVDLAGLLKPYENIAASELQPRGGDQ